MNIQLSLNGVPQESFETLVARLPDDAVASPWRSTVPLVEYWQRPSSLEQLWSALQAPSPTSVELAFEHATPVRAGAGKASFTDLMIITDSVAVAIEAKFTEPRYETVCEWLGPKPTSNRRKVLGGWLDYIQEATGQAMSSDAVRELPYQLIHRTASVCAVARPVRAVVYQVFGASVPTYYEDDLRALLVILAPATSVSGWLHGCTVVPTAEYHTLQKRWQQGERKLAAEVRGLLSARRAVLDSPAVLRQVSA